MSTEIKLLEKVIHDGQVYEANETRQVPEALARYFVGKGWAEDPTGTITTGERVAGRVKAEIEPVSNKTASQ